MRVSFLLGSGISQPAKLPSIEVITEQVLSPKAFFRSDGICRGVEVVQPSPVLVQMQMPEMERIEQLLRWLKGQAELRYAANARRLVNYEDLAYLAGQIRDDWLGQYENPALGPLLCCALNLLPGLCSPEMLGNLRNRPSTTSPMSWPKCSQRIHRNWSISGFFGTQWQTRDWMK